MVDFGDDFLLSSFQDRAIVKSSRVKGSWAQGRYAEAQASADSAKKWVTWSVIVGLIVIVINVILAVAGTFNASDTSTAMLAAMF